MENYENYNGEMEELYKEAVKAVETCGQCSPSFLQRKLRLGYVKASKLVDMLEERKVVGKYNGAKPREIFINHKN